MTDWAMYRTGSKEVDGSPSFPNHFILRSKRRLLTESKALLNSMQQTSARWPWTVRFITSFTKCKMFFRLHSSTINPFWAAGIALWFSKCLHICFLKDRFRYSQKMQTELNGVQFFTLSPQQLVECHYFRNFHSSWSFLSLRETP